MYMDTFDAWTPENAALNAIAGNNIKDWVLAPVSQTNATLIQGINCNLHLTPNVDVVDDPGVLNKIANIDTLNWITCQPAINLPASCVIHGYQRASAGGRDYWFRTVGEQENEGLVPCTCTAIIYIKQPKFLVT